MYASANFNAAHASRAMGATKSASLENTDENIYSTVECYLVQIKNCARIRVPWSCGAQSGCIGSIPLRRIATWRWCNNVDALSALKITTLLSPSLALCVCAMKSSFAWCIRRSLTRHSMVSHSISHQWHHHAYAQKKCRMPLDSIRQRYNINIELGASRPRYNENENIRSLGAIE